MICDRCFHSAVCKNADKDYDMEKCPEFFELIKCEDCKYCDGDDNCDDQPRWCKRRKGEEFFVTGDFFCAGGKRRETSEKIHRRK